VTTAVREAGESDGGAVDRELAVVFGTGPPGVAVAEELRRAGTVVRMVNRTGVADVANVHLLVGDETDAAFVDDALRDATSVYV